MGHKQKFFSSNQCCSRRALHHHCEGMPVWLPGCSLTPQYGVPSLGYQPDLHTGSVRSPRFASPDLWVWATGSWHSRAWGLQVNAGVTAASRSQYPSSLQHAEPLSLGAVSVEPSLFAGCWLWITSPSLLSVLLRFDFMPEGRRGIKTSHSHSGV